MNKDYVMNPVSGRYIKKGGELYRKLLKDKVLKEEDNIKVEIPVIKPVIKPPIIDLKTKATDTMLEVIENKKEHFKGLSLKETDRMLRKLLIKKLKIKKKKKKKKKKHRTPTPSSSEAETSSSESD